MAADRRLVLVTGSTRSGTSLAAGSLHHLGLHVPLPVLPANESNPAGFFESTWPLWFHRRLMDKCVISQTDARPVAFRLMANAVTDSERQELREWLERVFRAASQVVIKDPRAAWVPWLWTETATGLGATAGCLVMVRHPAEVVASRTTYCAADRRDRAAWRYQVRNLCTWINVNSGVERRTRDQRRVIARYDDFVADWRPVVARIGDAVGLVLELDGPGARTIDGFVDARLRRHEPSWDGLDLPAPLVDIAEGVWQAMGEIADGRDEPAASARLDELTAAYAREMEIAQAMTRDALVATRLRARRAAGHAGAASARDGGPIRQLIRRWVPVRIRRLVGPRLRRRSRTRR